MAADNLKDETIAPADTAQAADESPDNSADSEVANKIPILSEDQMENNILVGVCGAQAAGKTVFLAAIFHTMTGTAVDGIGHISSDKKAGGAQYFELVENTILDKNQAIPTRESAVARLVAYTAGPDGARSETGIILFDFAGGYFTAFADINAAKRNAPDEQTRQDIEIVAEYLEKCDAFILLIDAFQFRPGGESKANPFSQSVLHIIDHCERQRKPIALVFTKKDLNPKLTLETVLGFPRVKQFMSRFTSDTSQSDKPFGMVNLLAAYEHEDLSPRVRRRQDNTIWLEEPAKVFSKVTQAAWPRATERLQETVYKRKEEEEAVAQAEQRVQANKRLYVRLGIAVAALVIVCLVTLRFWDQIRQQQDDIAILTEAVDLVRQGEPEQVETRHYDALKRVQEHPGDAKVDKSLRDLEAACRKSLQRVPESVYTGPAQVAATNNLLELAAVAGLQQDPAINLLGMHQNILAAAGSCKPPALGTHIAVLSSVPSAAIGQRDSAFTAALIREADDLRAVCANEMVEAGKTKSTVMDRINFIRERLAEDRKQALDPRWKAALSRSYVKFLGASLTGLTARNDMVELLRSNPAFQSLLYTPDDNSVQLVRYRFITEAIRKLDAHGLETLRRGVKPLLKKFVRNKSEAETLALEDILQRLFAVEANETCDCQNLWLGLFEGVDSEYLFVLKADEWPSGYKPWKDELRARLRSADYSKEETTNVIKEISTRSMYWREADGIASLAGEGHFALESARLYDEAATRLADGDLQNVHDSAGPIRQIAVLAGSIHDEREENFGIDWPQLRFQRDSAAQLANRLESTRSSGPDAADWLRQYCESQLRIYGVRCAN